MVECGVDWIQMDLRMLSLEADRKAENGKVDRLLKDGAYLGRNGKNVFVENRECFERK